MTAKLPTVVQPYDEIDNDFLFFSNGNLGEQRIKRKFLFRECETSNNSATDNFNYETKRSKFDRKVLHSDKTQLRMAVAPASNGVGATLSLRRMYVIAQVIDLFKKSTRGMLTR